MTESLFGTPPAIDTPDNAEDVYTMSTRITFAVAGNIVGIRWWPASNDITTQPFAAVYDTGGVLQTSEQFPPGPYSIVTWNTLMLAAPFAVSAGQTLDIAVGPKDRYAANLNTFAAPVVSGNLTGTAGRFIASAVLAFPNNSSTTWYAIDVLFDAGATVTGTMDVVLPELESLFAGDTVVSGTFDPVLPTTIFDGAAEVTAAGTLDVVLPALVVDQVGSVTVSGTLNVVLPAIDADFTGVSAAGGATVDPCGWTIPDPLCCPEWAATSAGIKSSAQDYAATILWAATGRQYGLCQVAVRPCGMKACQDGMGEFWGFDWSGGTWVPYIFNGQWFNCVCPGICCCDPRCQVRLMGPVESIVEVTIGGIAVDPSTYRVDDNHWLVRTGGGCWPICADMDSDDGSNVFVVTYLRGSPVPAALLRAASTLACEWAKACNGGDCRLSNRVTSMVRNGITIDMVDPTALLDDGLTGLWEVDTVIRALNPYNNKQRMRIYAPELNVPRTVTSP